MNATIANLLFGKSDKSGATTAIEKKTTLTVPEDSMLRRHFLTHLRSVVEFEILPQSIDPTLKHYYEAAVAAEFQKRLIS